MFNEELVNAWLYNSGVWNEFTHFENEKPITFLTSIDELRALIEQVYFAGYKSGAED